MDHYSITYGFYELKTSEDGRLYKVIARINSSIGYERAREIANEMTDGQFAKYEGGFYLMTDRVVEIEIFES
jgi:hypothetical protein